MGTPSYVSRWVEERRGFGPQPQGVTQADTLELLDLCEPESPAALALHQLRRHSLVLDLADHGAFVLPRVLSSSAPGSGGNEGEVDALANTILRFDAGSVDVAEAQEHRLACCIAALAQRAAPATSWAEVYRSDPDSEPLSARAAFYRGIIALNAGLHDSAIDALRRAEILSEQLHGRELSEYRRVLSAALWHANRHDESLEIMRRAFPADTSGQHWEMLRDLVAVSPQDALAPAARAAARLARDLFVSRLSTDPSVPGSLFPLVQRVVAGSLEANMAGEDWEAVLLHWAEAAAAFRPDQNSRVGRDNLLAVHNMRIGALLELDRVPEAFAALDEQISEIPESSHPISQPLRARVLRLAASHGETYLSFLEQPPPTTIDGASRIAAVRTAATHLEDAGRIAAAVELISHEIVAHRDSDPKYFDALAEFVASRLVVWESPNHDHWRQVQAILTPDPASEKFPLLAAEALRYAGSDDFAQAIDASLRALAVIDRTPNMVLSTHFRGFLVRLITQARRQDLGDAAATLLDHAIRLGPPPIAALPSDERPDAQTDWTQLLLLAGRAEEAMDTVVSGLSDEIIGGVPFSTTQVSLWFRAFRQKFRPGDEGAIETLKSFEKVVRDLDDPNAVHAFLTLRAEFLAQANAHAPAMHDFTTAAPMHVDYPGYAPMLLRTAWLLATTQEPHSRRWADAVLAIPTDAFTSGQDGVRLHLIRVEAEALLGRWEAATADADLAFAFAEQSEDAESLGDSLIAALFASLGRVGLKNPAQAIRLFKRALSWRAADPAFSLQDASTQLAKLQRLIGNSPDPKGTELSRPLPSSGPTLALDPETEQHLSRLRSLLDLELEAHPQLRAPQPVTVPLRPQSVDINHPLVFSEIMEHVAALKDAHEALDSGARQELFLAEVLTAKSPDDPAALELWRGVVNGWEHPPASLLSARTIATLATSCEAHSIAASALAAGATLSTSLSRPMLATIRLQAGALSRADRTGEALDLLAHHFVAAAKQHEAGAPEEPHAFRLLNDLLSIAREASAEPEDRMRAGNTAMASWLRVARAEDVPSPDQVPGTLNRRNADIGVRILYIDALRSVFLELGRTEVLLEHLAHARELYPEHPQVSTYAVDEAVALWTLERNVEALTALDQHLHSQPPSRHHPKSGDLRCRIIASMRADEAGAAESLRRLPPAGLRPKETTQCVLLAAKGLIAWHRPAEAKDLVIAAAQLPVIRESEQASWTLGDFFCEQISDSLWQRASDEVLTAPPELFGAYFVEALLHDRARRRARTGDFTGAVHDALRATPSGDGASRRNARTLLRQATTWTERSENGDELLPLVHERELAIGPPPAPQDDDREGYVRELGMWADALHALGRDREALEFRSSSVAAAAELGDEGLLTDAIERETRFRGTIGQRSGGSWALRTTELLEALEAFPAPATRSLLLFHRAHAYAGMSEPALAVESVHLAAANAQRSELPDHRRLDTIKLLGSALTWDGVSVAQKTDLARALIAMVEAFAPDSTQYRRTSLIRLLRAHLMLRDEAGTTSALARLKSVIELEDSGASRDEAFTELAAVARSGVVSAEALADLARDTWDWYLQGQGDEPVRWAVWTAERLFEATAYDEVHDLCAAVIAMRPGPLEQISIMLVERALQLAGVGQVAPARRFLDLESRIPEGGNANLTRLRVHADLSLQYLERRFDEFFRGYAAALDSTIKESDPESRLSMSLLLLQLSQAVSLDEDLWIPLKYLIRDDIRAGVAVPATFSAPTLSTLLHTIGVSLGDSPSHLSLPDPERLDSRTLILRLGELQMSWQPGRSHSSRILEWLDQARSVSRADAFGEIAEALAHLLWANLTYEQVDFFAQTTQADAHGRTDTVIPEAMARSIIQAARRCFELIEHNASPLTLHFVPGGLVVGLLATFDVSNAQESEHTARWLLAQAIRWSLRIDARAAASTDLEQRDSLLTTSSATWALAFDFAGFLDDDRARAEIIAVRRSSLVLNTRPATGTATAPGPFRDPTQLVHPEDLEAFDPQPAPSPEFAAAASSALLAGIRGEEGIAARPRPMVMLPDGGIALTSMLDASPGDDLEEFFTPVVVSL